MLTNSLAANDEKLGACRCVKRRALLRAGVQLYELKPGRGSRSAAQCTARSIGVGSSRRALHAKTFTSMADWIFVGSFNFRPALGAPLNTEMGVW